MDARKALKLRDTTQPAAATNTTAQRKKNRQLIDEALQEAEVFRCKTVQLGRVWKHNAEQLRQEREHRQEVEKDVAQRYLISDNQVKELHALVVLLGQEVATLNREGDTLEAAIAQYNTICQKRLRESDLMQQRLLELKQAKEDELQSTDNIVSEMRLKVAKLEGMTAHVDQQIAEEEQEQLRLKLDIHLGGE